jgi:acyl dehydratase
MGSWEDTEALVGTELARFEGPDPVSRGDIRRRLEVLAWDCPLHYDAEIARGHGYRDVVAPATMLMTWAMPAYWSPGDPRPELDDPVLIPPFPACRIPAPGPHLFATSSETEYFEPVYPGDRISARSVLHSVVRKRLSVGDGAFLAVKTTYTKETGEVVGVETTTFFRYTAEQKERRDEATRRVEARGHTD